MLTAWRLPGERAQHNTFSGVSVASQDNPRARIHASHSWSVCSHLILKFSKMPLMCAAKYTKSPAVVELLLEAYADPNATDYVSGWDRDGVGYHMEWL